MGPAHLGAHIPLCPLRLMGVTGLSRRAFHATDFAEKEEWEGAVSTKGPSVIAMRDWLLEAKAISVFEEVLK